MNSADMSGLERKRWNWEKSRNCQVQLQKRSGLVKIIVTIQYLHSFTCKNPFQISFADGIFVFQSMFSYGQRSKCAELLNSYK